MENEIILTHTGKLGDFLYSLMVGSWLHKTRGAKIHWVLPQSFKPFSFIGPLLLAQEQTAAVSLVDYPVRNWECGGQPYRFNPADFGVIAGEYYNLGFRHYPEAFIPEFYASEHGFGVDYDFTLSIPDKRAHNGGGFTGRGKSLRTRETAMERIAPGSEPIPAFIDLLDLAAGLKEADEVHSWFCGIAVLCWMARIRASVYWAPGHAYAPLFFPEPRTIKLVSLSRHPGQGVDR